MRPLPIVLVFLILPLISCQKQRIPLEQDPDEPDTLALFGIPIDLWRCGTDAYPYLTPLIIKNINLTCPLAAADLNHCCAIHDDCYEAQRGRLRCDKAFCDCMSHLTTIDEEAAKCKAKTEAACPMLVANSGAAYNASAGFHLNEARTIPANIPEIKSAYIELFEKCDEQISTVSSCALNYDLCHKNPMKNNEKCRLNLIRCLDRTSDSRDIDKVCDMAIERVLFELIEKSDENGGKGGDLNMLVLADVTNNVTLVRRVYLQVVRISHSMGWVSYFVYFCLFASCIICCLMICIGLSKRETGDDLRRREVEEVTINVHSTTQSPRNGVTTSSIEQNPKSPKSSIKSSKSSSKISNSSTKK